MSKQQQVIQFWCERISTLKPEFEKELNFINSSTDEFFNNENHRIYSLVSNSVVKYFDNALRNKEKDKLKLFFSTFNDFYSTFADQFISQENNPKNLIKDILYTNIFEGVGSENKRLAVNCMPKSLKKEYKQWLKLL